MTTLTEHLLKLETTPKYSEATRHTFLTQAGNGTLPNARLALWLSQDRIYAAHGYPRFIGSLITRIPFRTSDSVFSDREKKHEYILANLVKCLDNIVTEVDFFQNAAGKWDLDMDGWAERKGTRDYTAEFARITQGESGLEDGLIFLWAMERVYFDAWSYVRSLQTNAPSTEGSAVESFAKNWSSPEFAVFVATLAELVDGLEITLGSEQWKRAEEIWQRVIELEVAFWPEDGEETKEGSRKRL